MGLFITFEGIEGCGKTTQAKLLSGHLEGKGLEVIAVREPGGTGLGERIRSILLNHEGNDIDYWAELFCYEACRAQLIKDIIRPALDAGKTVICDRFTDSTVSYQGCGRGLDLDAVTFVNSCAAQGLIPDITFLLDCPPEVGLKRALDRINAKEGAKEDRFEKEALGFHRRVREGFLKSAKKEPERIKVVKGEREPSVIHAEICGIIDEMI